MMRVEFYRTPSGRSPVEDYLKGLPMQESAEIERSLNLLSNMAWMPRWFRCARSGPSSGSSGSRNRIFYVVLKRDLMVLLHAYKKRGQKAPISEIETALRRMSEVME